MICYKDKDVISTHALNDMERTGEYLHQALKKEKLFPRGETLGERVLLSLLLRHHCERRFRFLKEYVTEIHVNSAHALKQYIRVKQLLPFNSSKFDQILVQDLGPIKTVF